MHAHREDLDGRDAAISRQVQVAMVRARFAQETLSRLSPRSRASILTAARKALAGRARDLAELAGRASTASIPEILASEVLPLLEAFRFLEREAPSILAPRRHGRRGLPAWLRGISLEVRREPFGVVLVIGPSNYPLFLPAIQAAQAIAAGNAVLLKPAPGGGEAADAVRKALEAGGLPPGALQTLPEDVDSVRAAIDAGADKVALTGSAETGVDLLSRLAPRIVPATLELSGCDASFVREDADLELAARCLAFGMRWNAGRTCIAPRRVLAAARIVENLEARLAAAFERLPPRVIPARDALAASELVQQAVDLGARLLSGGGPAGEEAGFRPALLAGASPRMDLFREDILAPVLAIVPVSGDEEALRIDAACPYALGASVFGAEEGARELALRVRAGVVVINDMIAPTADPRMPFGGTGRSGFGVTRGAEGLLDMTRVKAITIRRGGSMRHLEELRPGDERMLEELIRAAHGRGPIERLSAFVGLARGALRRMREAGAGSDPGILRKGNKAIY